MRPAQLTPENPDLVSRSLYTRGYFNEAGAINAGKRMLDIPYVKEHNVLQ